MKTLIAKTAQIFRTIMFYAAVSPLLPVIGLMHLVAIICDEKVESGNENAPTGHFQHSGLSSARQALVVQP